MKKKYYFIITVALVIIIAVGFYFYNQSQGSWPPPNVVREPGEAGQWVLVNELAIIASGQEIMPLITEFGGEITIFVSETGTYQVKFPVSSLEDLDIIADKLREKENGIKVMRAIVINPGQLNFEK